jgi:radical SAM protein with 4Fe4S-binding SPASM domain
MDELSIEVTYKCANRCIMCSSSASCPSPLKNELTLLEIKKLISDSQIGTLKPKNLSLSGGDPLERSDVFEIIKYAQQNYMKTLLYTTGQTIDEKEEIHPMTLSDARKLKILNVKTIFDIQSPDEKICDKIMGRDGYFERVMKNINLCKSVGLEVETHFVPMTLNFKHFFDYINMIKDLKIDKFSVLRFVRQGRGHENSHLEISKSQFKDLQFMFLRAEEENIAPMRLGHPVDRRFLISPKYKVPVCRGATDAPLIHPEGSVVMCPAWKELTRFRAGNIREQTLEDVMKNNPFYNIFHDFIHTKGYKNIIGKCQECPYLSSCRGGCVAQRLIHNVGKANIPLEEAIKIGADPMCFYNI